MKLQRPITARDHHPRRLKTRENRPCSRNLAPSRSMSQESLHEDIDRVQVQRRDLSRVSVLAMETLDELEIKLDNSTY